MNLQQALAALVSDDEETRRLALDAVRDIPLADSRAIIFLAMGDASWRVRKEAVELLVCSRPGRDSIEALLQLLRSDENAGLRNSAVEAIIRLGMAAAEPLIVMSRDTDADVRKFVIDVMGAIGDRSFVPALVQALHDPEVNVASAAAEQLGVIGDGSVARNLMQAIIERSDVLFRFSALGALGLLAKPAALSDEILQLAQDDILRKAVFDCIGNVADESSLATLLDGLSCRQKSSRAAALKALHKLYVRSVPETRTVITSRLRALDGSDIVPAVLELYALPDATLSAAVIWLCSMTHDERCIPTLFKASADESNAENALEALKNLEQDGLTYSVTHAELFDDNGRSVLCTLIGESGSTCYHDFVLAALGDSSATVRRAAVAAVAKLGLLSSLSVLETLLDDPAPDVCTAAVFSLRALAALDPAAVRPIAQRLSESQQVHHRRASTPLLAATGDCSRLLLLIKDEQVRVRKAAISAIGLLRKDPQCLQLVTALTDDDPDVRRVVAETLGSFEGSPEVLAALEQALNDEDFWVQCAVIKAIARIQSERAVALISDIYLQAHEMLLITCLQILGTHGGNGADSIISWALDSPDADVVRQARLALDQLSHSPSSSGPV
ncbi:MAG TPA: hypothetical protein HPP94_16060 [Desulfuromonadales bacterium]|nr:hypothetical protein [Desulfuromonadales bacterium]